MENRDDYRQRGRFSFRMEVVEEESDPTSEERVSMKLWVPLAPTGCRLPVVHFANGTGAACASYAPILEHLASHGFLTACYESPNSAQNEGALCLTALETVYRKHPELAGDQIGSAGHGLGGDAALHCLLRAEERWGAAKRDAGYAMAPESGTGSSGGDWRASYARIRAPLLLASGSADTLVSPRRVESSFDALADSTEAYWYEAQGATHVPVPERFIRDSALAFFRWKLLDETRACEYVESMAERADWELRAAQSERRCGP